MARDSVAKPPTDAARRARSRRSARPEALRRLRAVCGSVELAERHAQHRRRRAGRRTRRPCGARALAVAGARPSAASSRRSELRRDARPPDHHAACRCASSAPTAAASDLSGARAATTRGRDGDEHAAAAKLLEVELLLPVRLARRAPPERLLHRSAPPYHTRPRRQACCRTRTRHDRSGACHAPSVPSCHCCSRSRTRADARDRRRRDRAPPRRRGRRRRCCARGGTRRRRRDRRRRRGLRRPPVVVRHRRRRLRARAPRGRRRVCARLPRARARRRATPDRFFDHGTAATRATAQRRPRGRACRARSRAGSRCTPRFGPPAARRRARARDPARARRLRARRRAAPPRADRDAARRCSPPIPACAPSSSTQRRPSRRRTSASCSATSPARWSASAAHGADAFYRGPVARRIAAAVRARGGVLDAADLRAYRRCGATPLRRTVRGRLIVTFPPPGSGGDRARGPRHPRARRLARRVPTAPGCDLLAGAMAQAFADRARWYGDPAFTAVPVDALLAPAASARASRAACCAPVAARPSHGRAALPTPAPANVSVVDADGDAVVDHHDDQHHLRRRHHGPRHRHHPERRDGRLRARAGRAERLRARRRRRRTRSRPGKRPQSSMSPTIVLDGDASRAGRGRLRRPAHHLRRAPDRSSARRRVRSRPRCGGRRAAHPRPGSAAGAARRARASRTPHAGRLARRWCHPVHVMPDLGAVSAAGSRRDGTPHAAGDPRKDGGAVIVR